MPASTQTDWPQGVIARYVTVGDATVDVSSYDEPHDKSTQARCGGCGQYDTSEWVKFPYGRDDAEWVAKRWAQSHAETCRAVPKSAA